ncbi:17 kDa surface antigen [Iodidimonas gelatinilytica]|uniref:17 kDa surface antigen n=1 Tax=Iodidimonas gelatinilytica TaxID=1236966 RepID=A0A5A7N107_9PROT|nr:RT0821/Lpp0805 family surface protein [Iodidimonas gelatinilytica]GEQ97763.1 17 kDa surface antigen [Iodidimonas gelatinilytica]GER01030.1 17 kDa surface antigen [Iodidimonas gelatinilytica]
MTVDRIKLSMSRLLKMTGAALLFASLAACSNQGNGEKEFWGTVVGGIAGGLIGSEIGGRGDSGKVGAALGAVAGAAIGNQVGKDLDRADRIAMAQAQQQAFETAPSGTRTEWYNPDTGNRGWVEPKPAYQGDDERYCREYTQTIYVGGEAQTGYGTACRQPDGDWKIIQ